jgi:TRAP-type C4-dicarboxylate transport system permease small subunit
MDAGWLKALRRGWETLEEFSVELLLLFLAVLNAMNIVSRYVLHRSIGQTFELMILLSLVMYWLGIGMAQRFGGHLGMNFVVNRLSPPARKGLARVRILVMAAFLAVVVWSGLELAVSQYGSHAVSGAMNMPLWIFSLAMPFGALVMLLRIVRGAWGAGR